MGSDKDKIENNLIFVTGFGPFSGHENCNASWEAVRLLPDEVTVNDKQYRIEKLKVPVVYSDVDRIVPEIWEKDPQLVIHCGVHSAAEKVCLEQCAYKSSYCRPDWEGKCRPTATADLCRHGQDCDKLQTTFDVHKFAEDLNKVHDGIFYGSVDVGQYLCGYIYIKSLDYSPSKTLFIHVPPVEVISPSVVHKGILGVIHKCLEK